MSPRDELRSAALEARRSLDAILPGDHALADRVAAALDAAFDLPPDRGGRALRAALAIDGRVKRWTLGLVATAPAPTVRLPAPDVGMTAPIDTTDTTATGDAGPRVLRAQAQERIESGRLLTVRVDIGLTGEGATLPGLPAGAEVLVRVSAPGLEPRGELQRSVTVPAGRDSDPVLFEFVAGAHGLQRVLVEAYRAGTFLGKVRLQVSVEASTETAEGQPRLALMSTVAFEPGEVTLIVERADGGYRFQLLGARTYRPVQALMGGADQAAAAIVGELTDLAAGRTGYDRISAVERRLRNLGVDLWSTAVPARVQEQFWAELDRISSFTILADDADIPFELLYPLSTDHDAGGFLVEQFPVVRRAFDTDRVRSSALGRAAYVVSDPAPVNAHAEVAALRELLGAQLGDSRVITELAGVQDSAELRGLGLLHLAGHNRLDTEQSSFVPMVGGPWKPSDLSPAVATRSLAATAPLVFFNACRSAGELDGLSAPSGWAERFMQAGAAAFVGSLWAVRSTAAQMFAETFYIALVEGKHNLGDAALTARRTVARDAGDPTWLAYTVYGNPATTFEVTGDA